MDSSTVYTATITTGAEDAAGNNLAVNYVWTFTTGDPGDVTAPTVSLTVPANLAVNVSTVTNVTVTFSEPMDPSTINGTSFTLTDGSTQIPGTVSYAGGTATFNPSIMLDTITIYSGRITTAATDVAGNPLQVDFTWIFTTERSPAVTSTVPAASAFNVPITANVAAQFGKAMDVSSINGSTFTLSQGGNGVAGTVSASGTNALFTPSSDLLPNTVYTATITTGVTDVSGNHMTADKVWSFTTGSSVDVTAPTVNATDPANAASGVARDATVRAFFSEVMDLSSLTPASFTVKLNGVEHAGTVTYAETIATYTPTTMFAPNSVYTATVTTVAKDISGNSIAVDHVWTFTTGP